MFETVHIHTRIQADGHLRVDLPSDIPAESEVEVTVSVRTRRPPLSQAEWEAHVDRIAGSIPDLERPEQWPMREIEPL